MEIDGKWYVVYSTFPKWKKEGIENLTFNYSRIEKNGKEYLLDEVKYTFKGKQKSIKGYDSPDVTSKTNFTWRGKGWLVWFSSKWKIIWFNKEEDCAVIVFEKTLFSPAGMDIICRSNNPGNKTIADALVAASSADAQLRHKLYRIV